MGWEDREYARDDGGDRNLGRPGGDWRGLRPSFDNPFSWSLGLGRWFGIDVRVHFLLLLFILIELFRSLGAADESESLPITAYYALWSLGALFLIILLHEFGHCVACRMTGGQADEILMWPLGGLAYCAPPHRWTAHLWTVIGGPLVNVVLGALFAIALGVMTGAWWTVAIPVPFMWPRFETSPTDFEFILFLIARMNMALLLFNLLPVFPLDGGRLLQAVLWSRFGYGRAMRFSVRVGYIGAIGLGVLGAATSQFMLVGVAVFGFITCWITHKQLQFTDEVMYDTGYSAGNTEAQPAGPSKRDLKRLAREREQAAKDEAELDRLLKKIAERGMGSLSRSEQKWLRTQSKRKRAG